MKLSTAYKIQNTNNSKNNDNNNNNNSKIMAMGNTTYNPYIQYEFY